MCDHVLIREKSVDFYSDFFPFMGNFIQQRNNFDYVFSSLLSKFLSGSYLFVSILYCWLCGSNIVYIPSPVNSEQ